MRALRRILVLAAICLVAVPTAVAMTADPFGPPEVVDPEWWPQIDYSNALLAVDGSGNALWASFVRDDEGDEQMAIYERCGTTWTRRLLGTPTDQVYIVGVKVAPNGTAMAVWQADGVFYSSVRPPGGTWGAPQEIVDDPDVSSIRFALADNGSAIAVFEDGSPQRGIYGVSRPAGGDWGDPGLIVAAVDVQHVLRHDVALSATGDAVLLFQQSTPGYVYSRYRAAGGSWGAEQKVLENAFQNTIKNLDVEFDGLGRAVAAASFNEGGSDAIRVNVRSAGAAGAWGNTTQTRHDLEPNAQQFTLRGVTALARHSAGLVALWSRNGPSASNPQLVVSRLSAAGWDTPKVFGATGSVNVGEGGIATNANGEVMVVGQVESVSGPDGIYASIAPSIVGAWPDMTLVSPETTAASIYRDAVAGGGGSAFYVGWGVHGSGNQRSEAISTKAAGTCGGGTGTPTPTPTATSDPSPNPQPLPPSGGGDTQPSPLPQQTTVTPSAIRDFTTLPAASRCVRNRKLTVRFKKPPKGYAVKTITVRVNGRKVATVKGAKLKKPLYLRKLPKGAFTVTVSIKLKKGKGLTERRRYRACK
ncbi:MAG TPA: hypothetical protein VFZ00_06430 [Solirubrobacter sp.]|nr:hypothetical protein [Solirubrobacter sp.]